MQENVLFLFIQESRPVSPIHIDDQTVSSFVHIVDLFG